MEEPGATCGATPAPPANGGHGADGPQAARAVAAPLDLDGAVVTREMVDNTYDAVCKALALVERAGMACEDSPSPSLGPEDVPATGLTPTEPESTPDRARRTPVDVDSSPRHAPEPDHAPEPTPSEVLIPEVGKPCRGRKAKAKASSAKAKKATNPKSSPKKKAAPKSLPKSRATRKAAAPKAAAKAKVKAMGKGRAKKTKRSAEDAEMGDAALASENVEMGPEATETVEGGVATTAEMGAGLAVEARETADSTVHMPARAGMAEMAENTETPEATEHRYANGMTEKEVARKMHSASWRVLTKVSWKTCCRTPSRIPNQSVRYTRRLGSLRRTKARKGHVLQQLAASYLQAICFFHWDVCYFEARQCGATNDSSWARQQSDDCVIERASFVSIYEVGLYLWTEWEPGRAARFERCGLNTWTRCVVTQCIQVVVQWWQER